MLWIHIVAIDFEFISLSFHLIIDDFLFVWFLWLV